MNSLVHWWLLLSSLRLCNKKCTILICFVSQNSTTAWRDIYNNFKLHQRIYLRQPILDNGISWSIFPISIFYKISWNVICNIFCRNSIPGHIRPKDIRKKTLLKLSYLLCTSYGESCTRHKETVTKHGQGHLRKTFMRKSMVWWRRSARGCFECLILLIVRKIQTENVMQCHLKLT